MTNQDNLPVWARILLGIPTDDGVLRSQAAMEQENRSNRPAIVQVHVPLPLGALGANQRCVLEQVFGSFRFER